MVQDVRGVGRRFNKSILFGLFAVGVVIFLAAWFSLHRIESQLANVGDARENALRSLLLIDSLSNDGAQELFAYILSGNAEELSDYRTVVDSLTVENTKYASIANLTGALRVEDLKLFSLLQSAWTRYLALSELMISEYQREGLVSPGVFHNVELALDEYFKNLDAILVVESQRAMFVRTQRDELLRESETLLAVVAALGILALGIAALVITRRLGGYLQQLAQRDEDILLRGAALDAALVGICYTAASDEQPVVYVNDAMLEITGYAREDFIGKNCRFLQGEETNIEDVAKIRKAVSEGREIQLLVKNYRKNGDPYWNDMSIAPVRNEQGELTHFVGAMHDVTESRDLELRLARSQKMEAVGQLAGGVAHDFNNYLTVISGNAEVITLTTSDEQSRAQARQIMEAGDRSAQLTRQLLALSGRQIMVPQVMDLNRVIMELDPLLRRTLGGNINLETVTAAGLGRVSADRSQIEQVVLNLVVNARDALPHGGKITIETGNVFLDSEYVEQRLNSKEGRHVMIAVSDDGIGMSRETLDKIFEPFFSTKEVGSTGLGLSTVLGIVEQTGGSLQVYSEENAGTTFKVYLPRVIGEVSNKPVFESAELENLSGCILVVEDEKMVCEITCEMLRALGMEVLSADNGEEGLEIIKAQGHRIDVLLTDVMLPGLDGRKLADEAAKHYPSLAILFMSGYTENGILHQGRLDEGVELLGKPFTQNELKRKVAIVMRGSPKTLA